MIFEEGYSSLLVLLLIKQKLKFLESSDCCMKNILHCPEFEKNTFFFPVNT